MYVGKPLRRREDRKFLTGRDHVTTARMAFDEDGIILGMEVDTIAALGGYIGMFGMPNCEMKA